MVFFFRLAREKGWQKGGWEGERERDEGTPGWGRERAWEGGRDAGGGDKDIESEGQRERERERENEGGREGGREGGERVREGLTNGE